MSDKKQPETEQPRQQNKGWSWGTWIIMIVLGVFSLFICWLYLFPEFICWLYLFPEQWATKKHIWLQLYLGALAVAGVVALCKPQIITSSSEKYFITRVLTTGITGGAFALLLPIAVKSTTTGVGGLRHSILLATGGLLAILTLGETRRKNDIDKRKNKQEKKKNDRDHRRQVRAERRERYTKAVEQLGDEKASVRMGGVYTLVGLVDEWLEDESIEKYKDRLKEGQVIINNLCAYIRSPFTLASQYGVLSRSELNSKNKLRKFIRKYIQRDFYINKANLQAEADVRLSIIKEIHDRLQGPEENTPGTWSDFEYDFSGSTFFYPVDFTNSYYKKPVNFRNSTYHSRADFKGSTYHSRADFKGSTYHSRADFRNSTYQSQADFCNSTYQSQAFFSGSTYQSQADFCNSTYEKDVIFSASRISIIFMGEVDYDKPVYKGEFFFSNSTYQGDVSFIGSTYQNNAYFSGSTYQGDASFGGSTYKWANFAGSTYKSGANFTSSTYKSGANFTSSTYKSGANFTSSTYENETDFSGSIFYQEVYIGKNGDNGSFSHFISCSPQFYDKKKRKNTLFGSHNNNFTVDIDKGYPIDLDSKGIPLNCKFLTSEQKKYLEGKLQEIEKINNKLFEVKDLKEKEELLKKLQALNEELHEWREEATTVKVEDGAIENTES